MQINHDPQADAVYVRLSSKDITRTKSVRGNRSGAAIDLADDGSVVGVEFLGVRKGIDLKGIPNPAEITDELIQEGFSVGLASDHQRVERFIDVIVKGFMLHDIQVAIDGKANFLAALGLLDYTEILGGFVLGNVNAPGARKFDAYLPYLGSPYAEMDQEVRAQRSGKGLYSFRSLLTHTYGLSSRITIRMNTDQARQCGLEFHQESGWDFCVQQYFLDFAKSAERLRHGVKQHPELMANVLLSLGDSLERIDS